VFLTFNFHFFLLEAVYTTNGEGKSWRRSTSTGTGSWEDEFQRPGSFPRNSYDAPGEILITIYPSRITLPPTKPPETSERRVLLGTKG